MPATTTPQRRNGVTLHDGTSRIGPVEPSTGEGSLRRPGGPPGDEQRREQRAGRAEGLVAERVAVGAAGLLAVRMKSAYSPSSQASARTAPAAADQRDQHPARPDVRGEQQREAGAEQEPVREVAEVVPPADVAEQVEPVRAWCR